MQKICHLIFIVVIITGFLISPILGGLENNQISLMNDMGDKKSKIHNIFQSEHQGTYNDQLDQQQDEYNHYTFVIDQAHHAQSFQPQLEELTRVHLYMYKKGNISSDIVVSIRNDLYGPDLTTCSKLTSSIARTPGWIEFDFPDISVNIEDTYYIICSTDGGNFENAYVLGYLDVDIDPYVNGCAWEYGFFTDYEWEIMCDTCDLTFRSYGKQSEKPPIAYFNWFPNEPMINELVNFDASDSYDPDGLINFYEWDWDDDGEFDDSFDSSITSHQWTTTGIYPVTLRVIDNEGFSDTVTKNVVINDEDTGDKPIVSFEWTPSRPNSDEEVVFDASYSFDPDGKITFYEWDWDGDGVFDDSTKNDHINHYFDAPGEFLITLQIIDNQGLTNSLSRTIIVEKEWTITVPNDYPTIQEAIDHSQSGDRIYIKAGTYYEHLQIDREHITLQGEQKHTTIIKPVYDNPIIEIEKNACYCTISNITLDGGESSMLSESIGQTYMHAQSGIMMQSDYNVISDTIISATYAGIDVKQSFGTYINKNHISDNSVGVLLNQESTGIEINHNIIQNNYVHGIVIEQTSQGNEIINNTITGNAEHGIDIIDVSKGNHILWNTIHYNQVGINCEGFSDGNYFHHNSLVGNNQNAFDSSYDRWNDDVQGNYWSDYDEEDSDGDGIGDIPYQIPGGLNKDNFPLMNPPDSKGYDVAGLYMYFSTEEWDSSRSYEIPELVEGDEVFFTTWWDLIPDQCLTEWEYYNMEYEYWLDGKLYDRFNWEHQLDPYEWTPDFCAPKFIEWQHERWNATYGNHTFRAIFDPFDKFNEPNEENNEIIVDFFVSKKKDIVAQFNWNPEYPTIDESVVFDASDSKNSQGEISSYEWDWTGDGVYDQTTLSSIIEHSWSTEGTYTITLRIKDTEGRQDTVTKNITIIKKSILSVPEDYSTIQEAINQAEDGMIIDVKSGIYHEHIIINKSIQLQGAGQNSSVIDGSGENLHIVRITADDVEIKDFHITDCSKGCSGIRVYSNGNRVYNNLITNCGAGIECYGTMNNHFYENILYDNIWGLYIDDSQACTVELNNISENSFGISILFSSVNIVSNTIQKNEYVGLFEIQNSMMIIYQNKFLNNNEDGIKLFNTLASLIYDNEIMNNNGYGITCYQSRNNLIEKNKISDNQNKSIGLHFKSDDNEIVRNNMRYNNTEGILIDFSNNNLIDQNLFSNHNQTTDLCIIRIRSNAKNNKIIHNIFPNNCYSYDECGNFWDDGNMFGGNYWSDYTSIDYDRDGFGEPPYCISGGGNQDHYPLMKPWDPPMKPMIINSPSEGLKFIKNTFEVITTEPTMDDVQYGWDWGGDNEVDKWTSFYKQNTTISTDHRWWWKGSYDISVVARDTDGHVSSWSDPFTVEINRWFFDGNLLQYIFDKIPFISIITDNIIDRINI